CSKGWIPSAPPGTLPPLRRPRARFYRRSRNGWSRPILAARNCVVGLTRVRPDQRVRRWRRQQVVSADAGAPIQALAAIAVRARDDRHELAVALERSSHRIERSSLTQPERRESLAELGDARPARRRLARGHGCIRAPTLAAARCRRVTRAQFWRDCLTI